MEALRKEKKKLGKIDRNFKTFVKAAKAIFFCWSFSQLFCFLGTKHNLKAMKKRFVDLILSFLTKRNVFFFPILVSLRFGAEISYFFFFNFSSFFFFNFSSFFFLPKRSKNILFLFYQKKVLHFLWIKFFVLFACYGIFFLFLQHITLNKSSGKNKKFQENTFWMTRG